MFRPKAGHLQASMWHKNNIKIANEFAFFIFISEFFYITYWPEDDQPLVETCNHLIYINNNLISSHAEVSVYRIVVKTCPVTNSCHWGNSFLIQIEQVTLSIPKCNVSPSAWVSSAAISSLPCDVYIYKTPKTMNCISDRISTSSFDLPLTIC